MLSKCCIDTAEDVLKTYERAMRDRKRQGHCLSAEWRYKQDNQTIPRVFILRYPPEIFDMVREALLKMANTDKESFSVLRVQYAYISPYFKKSSRAALQKNQRARRKSASWCYEVERALMIFWEKMQQDKKFNKYF